jgi:predicted dinucleotide-binding enzyme
MAAILPAPPACQHAGMRIGVIGTGMIGGTLARLLAAAGHEVTVANSRGPAAVADLVAEIGDRATAGSAQDAAAAGEVVVVAIPFGRYPDLPAAELAGKVVVDANNYYPARDGTIAELEDGSVTSSELVAAALPGARVVKAFNTIYYVHLRDDGLPPGSAERRAIPIAGDDPEAKRVVTRLLDDIGFDAFDAGSLADSRRLEPGSPVYNVRLTRDEIAAALA